MQLISLDFETFFDKGYSLRGMMLYPDGIKRRATTEAYIRGHRFDPLCCCIRWPDSGTRWCAGKPDIKHLLNRINWDNTICVAHHAAFDGLILKHHYGIRPAYWLDTYSLASVILGNGTKVGLGALAEHYRLPAKSVPYNLFRGRHWEDLDLPTREQVLDGCAHDAGLTLAILGRLLADFASKAGQPFPQSELDLIDLTVRWFTEPELVGDLNLLSEVWLNEQQTKTDMLAELGVSADDLRSDARLVELFEAEGVEVAYKRGKDDSEIPCFAATDDWLREMCDHDDPAVGALARARMQIKANAVQTRAETLGWMATRGPMPVYLRYAGAHTTRWSGGDGGNFQNIKRGHPIRKAIRAPAGYLLAAPDSKQIECRILNTVAGQWDVIERFRSGADPYVALASAIYGRPITPADVAERGTGKQAELSCGYMAGAATFQRTAAKGTYGPAVKLRIEFAKRCVDLYRKAHPAICLRPDGYWSQAERMLIHLVNGSEERWGPLLIRDKRIWLPNGLPIVYDTLKREDGIDPRGFGYRLNTRRGWVHMYSGKLVENVVQALARVKIAEDILEIQRGGLRVKGMSHDEAWILIPQGAMAQQALQWCGQVMSRPARWLPACPFAADLAMAEHYPK